MISILETQSTQYFLARVACVRPQLILKGHLSFKMNQLTFFLPLHEGLLPKWLFLVSPAVPPADLMLT